MCPVLLSEGDDFEFRLRAKNEEGENIDFAYIDIIKELYSDGESLDKKDPEVWRWNKFTKSLRHYAEKFTTTGIIFDKPIHEVDPEIDNIINEYMNYGKELCKRLKAIRKAVADANGIEYNPTECHHKGHCPGTCPVCDAEIEAINKALVRKTAMGEDIVIPEVSVEDICHSGIDSHPMNPFAGEVRTPDEIKRIHQKTTYLLTKMRQMKMRTTEKRFWVTLYLLMN